MPYTRMHCDLLTTAEHLDSEQSGGSVRPQNSTAPGSSGRWALAWWLGWRPTRRRAPLRWTGRTSSIAAAGPRAHGAAHKGSSHAHANSHPQHHTLCQSFVSTVTSVWVWPGVSGGPCASHYHPWPPCRSPWA